jgi:hypothetical protein
MTMLASLIRGWAVAAALALPATAALAQAAPIPPAAPAAPPAGSATQPAPAPSAAPPTSAAPQPAAPALSASAEAEVDKRIHSLQSELGITPAQMPLWDAFAQAMRDNAASTEALFNRRAANVASMSATDNMHSYAQIARAYADATEHLATAFDSLYASLSETQKRAADNLFRKQATAASEPRSRR